MRRLNDLFFQELSRLADGESRHVGLSGCIGSGSERRNICILRGDYVNHLKRNAERLCCHLSKCSVRALSDLRLAYLHLNAAVLIEHHTAGGCFK